MRINEVSKLTQLTKKAIEYYTLQGLIVPSVLENGYREYDTQTVETLHKIRVLRKLDVSTEEIRCILNDTGNEALQAAAVKKELAYQRNLIKKALLQKLSGGKPYAEIQEELQFMEQSRTITEQLMEAFPGYYGRFICMHFARFLNEPIKTQAQQAAYETIVSFLDHLPDLNLPPELEEYLAESTKHIGTEQISEMLEATKQSYENPDEFLANNKEIVEQYLAYKKTEAYKNSPACKLMEIMQAFNHSHGYNDIFIPAMKQLSASYARYLHQAEEASKKLLAQYPEMGTYNNRGENE